MPGLSHSLDGKPSPAERMARKRRVDHATGLARFHEVWNNHINIQREWARDTGKFKKARGEGWTATPNKDGFRLEFTFKGEVSEVTITGSWNRRTAQAKITHG